MKRIRTETVIDAPPAAVWEVLTDLPSYAEWNPQTTTATGTLQVGDRIKLRIEPTGGRPATLRATVTVVDSPRRLEWVGGPRVPGLFRGRHAFELEALDGDRTRLVNEERLSGLLVPFVIRADAVGDYEAMNRALAERVESRSARSAA